MKNHLGVHGNMSGVSGPQSFVYGVPSSQSYQYDPSGTFTLSSLNPLREGCDFLGWGLNKNDNHINYEAGGGYWRMNRENWTVTCDKDDRDGYVYYLPNSLQITQNLHKFRG